jgi:hypothetical protein
MVVQEVIFFKLRQRGLFIGEFSYSFTTDAISLLLVHTKGKQGSITMQPDPALVKRLSPMQRDAIPNSDPPTTSHHVKWGVSSFHFRPYPNPNTLWEAWKTINGS